MTNVEIKARCGDLERVRRVLDEQGARHVGTDHQVDTYFRVADGRLKLREGTIERALIFYRRPDETGPKVSDVHLYPCEAPAALRAVLAAALGTLVVVDKQRDIFFIDNVKFHVDSVRTLGTFVEIEAIDRDETLGRDHLRRQCRRYLGLLGIAPADLVAESYSDLLLRRQE